VSLLLALPYSNTSLRRAAETALIWGQVRIECPLSPHSPQCFFLLLCAIYFGGVAVGVAAADRSGGFPVGQIVSVTAPMLFRVSQGGRYTH
jgi:hypothetical protein